METEEFLADGKLREQENTVDGEIVPSWVMYKVLPDL